ncbi:MAG: GNAT family N-acetyltransferase [Alkalibacterium sp.]|nr:GNAT family N-acetyltransferase [Alkalibacterium sp.]
MDYHIISPADDLWLKVAAFAKSCSWSAADKLGEQMAVNDFLDWERVLVAMEGDRIAGYCTLTEKDSLTETEFTPFIGYVFVDEQFRGERLSEQMVRMASLYLERLGYSTVYIYTGHVGLYEKYGFEVVKRWMKENNEERMILSKKIKNSHD